MNDVTFDTITLRPGTVLTYVRDGQKFTETLAVETEVALVAAVKDTISIVRWGDGEATAVEPA